MEFDQYKIHTIEKFQIIYDENKPKTLEAKINWLEFYQLLVEPTNGKNVINNNSKILVAPFNVSQFISVLDQTSPQTIGKKKFLNLISNIYKLEYLFFLPVNYVHWKFIYTMMPYTIELFRNISIELDVMAAKVPPPRQFQCIEHVEPEHAVAFKYVAKYLSHEQKKTVSIYLYISIIYLN